MNKHISSIVNSCFIKLRDFHHIHPFISKTIAIALNNAFVHSRLNFCNSLFYGLPKCAIYRPQKIQNTVVCIITNSPHFSHSATLISLHWLLIFSGVNYKICCIMHRALSLGEPYYLSTLLIH